MSTKKVPYWGPDPTTVQPPATPDPAPLYPGWTVGMPGSPPAPGYHWETPPPVNGQSQGWQQVRDGTTRDWQAEAAQSQAIAARDQGLRDETTTIAEWFAANPTQVEGSGHTHDYWVREANAMAVNRQIALARSQWDVYVSSNTPLREAQDLTNLPGEPPVSPVARNTYNEHGDMNGWALTNKDWKKQTI